MKAVSRFKDILARKRPRLMEGILGHDSRLVQPPTAMIKPHPGMRQRTYSADADNRRPIEQTLAAEGLHREIDTKNIAEPRFENRSATRHVSEAFASSPSATSKAPPTPPKPDSKSSEEKNTQIPRTPPKPAPHNTLNEHPKGHAHNPLEDRLYLRVGTGTGPTSSTTDDPTLIEDADPDSQFFSESPHAADLNIYDQAYREEVDRIRERHSQSGSDREPTVFLTRRVDNVKGLMGKVVERARRDHDEDYTALNSAKGGLARMLDKMRDKAKGGSDNAPEVEKPVNEQAQGNAVKN